MNDPIKPQADAGKSIKGGDLGNIDDQRGHPGKGTGGDTMKQEQNAPFPKGEKTEPAVGAAEGTHDQVPVRDNTGREPDIGTVHAAAGNEKTGDRSNLNVYERLAEKDVTPTEDSGW